MRIDSGIFPGALALCLFFSIDSKSVRAVDVMPKPPGGAAATANGTVAGSVAGAALGADSVRALSVKLAASTQPASPVAPVDSAASTRPVPAQASSGQLCDEVREIAQITGVLPVLEKLEAAQSELDSAMPHSIERIEKNQRILYLRQKIIQSLATALFEINSTRGKIDSASADLADAEAVLNEHRAATIRRNSMINFVSGGVTKMVGYGLALGDLNPLTTNMLEVMDGGIQSSLSGFTIADQRSEKQMLKAVPAFLGDLILEPKSTDKEYPQTIWRYLNSVPPGSSTKQTRRQLLLDNWKRNGILSSRPQAMKNANGRVIVNAALEGKWLAAHSAMLSDLKSVVSNMNTGLMVLSQIVKESYSVDSQF